MIAAERAPGKHEIVNESRDRGGRTQRRAVCSCGWSSTWQAGDIEMAVNAGQRHITHALTSTTGGVS